MGTVDIKCVSENIPSLSTPYSNNMIYWVYDFNYHYGCSYPYSFPIVDKSKVDTAFKVLKALQGKKVIDVTSVQKFIELVDEIAKVL
jgi:hypothetical protein